MSQGLIGLLLFDLDHQRFGLPIADVREVVRAVSFAVLPKAPKIVEGVVNFRGAAIAILDIRTRFRLPPRPIQPSDHLVIATAGLRTVAIRVDRVVDMVSLPEEGAIEAMENVTPHSDYISGIAKLPDRTVLIHDLAQFLSGAEAANLDEAVESLPA